MRIAVKETGTRRADNSVHDSSTVCTPLRDVRPSLRGCRWAIMYQGPIKGLVPFLRDFNLQCPPYYNPADFLMEVAIGEHSADITKMSTETTKQFNQRQLCSDTDPLVSGLNSLELGVMKSVDLCDEITPLDSVEEDDAVDRSHSASLVMQFLLLTKRNLTSARRNYMLLMMRLVVHMFIGVVFGYLYINVGNDASTVLANYVYLYGTLLLIVYTGKMSVMLSLPLEMEMLVREHFNRWYKLIPYYFSVILLEIPFQVACAFAYTSVSYWLTGNLPETFRVQYFILVTTAATLCAQSWGYFIGATTPIKIAVFLGPVVAVLFSIFGFCLRYVDIPKAFQWMFHVSYFRAAFQSLVQTIYGYDRELLPCPEHKLYCHYKFPKKFLSEMDIKDVDVFDNVTLIVGITVLMHVLTIIALFVKLNRR